MPSCRPDVIPGVLYKLMEMCPKTILDVGAGHGKWGVLCAEYLKYWKNIEPEIDGVEVFAAYDSPAYGQYRKIHHANVIELLPELGEYDLVLAVDVIEHLTRAEGEALLKASKRYLVSTPGYWSPQAACFGNVHETHVSRWTPEDFDSSLAITDVLGRPHILGWKS